VWNALKTTFYPCLVQTLSMECKFRRTSIGFYKSMMKEVKVSIVSLSNAWYSSDNLMYIFISLYRLFWQTYIRPLCTPRPGSILYLLHVHLSNRLCSGKLDEIINWLHISWTITNLLDYFFLSFYIDKGH
jgi:hypothetical protein